MDEFIQVVKTAILSELMNPQMLVDELKKAFKSIEKENLHFLNYNETVELFKQIGMHMKQKDVLVLCKSIDKDKNEQINLDEFI